ncbi:hypothetical protein tpqmel_0089 [Candidatus Gastranaerophilus sp. (ex Termes propinquus)]|nr:hypothetical protein tpqmel_0089 [Candidatus Gastranaerophilus sp. (ex Termes propinquus)]
MFTKLVILRKNNNVTSLIISYFTGKNYYLGHNNNRAKNKFTKVNI